MLSDMKIKKKSKKFNDAVKFIAKLQFPRSLVRKTLDNLLELYGGQWALIEENGYQLVIECILDEINTQCAAANIEESQFVSTFVSENKEVAEGNSKLPLENKESESQGLDNLLNAAKILSPVKSLFKLGKHSYADNQSGFKIRRLAKLKKLSSIGGLIKGTTTKSPSGLSATCPSSLNIGSKVNQSEANSVLLSSMTISTPSPSFFIELFPPSSPPPLPSGPPPDLPPPPPESEYECTSFNLLANMTDQYIKPVAHYSCGSNVESCKPERSGGWLSWDD